MKNKARLLFALVPFFAISFLTGCGPTGGDTPTPVPPEPVDPFPVNPKDSWCVDGTKHIQYVRINSRAAGLNSVVDTSQYGCGGTDLGFTWYDSEAKKLFVTFGDSYPQHMMGGQWNSNVTLYTSNFDFSKGVMWEGALDGSFGATRQITPVTHSVAGRNGWTASPESICSKKAGTTIPTGGIVVNGNYYMFYMEVYAFNQTHDYPGIVRNGMWDTFCSRVVKSSDKGKTWNVVPGLEWLAHTDDFVCQPGESFSQIHPLDIGDEYIYIYGIRGGRESGTCMGRVLKSKFEDINEYEYYAGKDKSNNPRYIKGMNGLKFIKDKPSCYVIDPKCGELNFSYNPYYGKYMVTYLQAQSNMVMRLMENPYTFGGAYTIAGQGNIPNLYGGATHEVMFDNDGRRMFMFICQWTSNLYSTNLVEVVFSKKK